jgi:chromosome segregation ATPase
MLSSRLPVIRKYSTYLRVMRIRPQIILIIILLISVEAIAQQRVPTLTTDDVIVPVAPVVNKTVSDEKKTEVIDKATKEKKDTEKKPDEKDSSKATSTEKRAANPDEKLWNEKLQRAKEKAAQEARLADQTELEINQLRNKLSSAQPSSPEQKRETLEKIAKLSKTLSEFKESAQSSQSEVAEVISNGKDKDYKVAEPKLTNEKGEVDKEAVTDQVNKNQQEVADAQARIQLLELQLNKLHSQGNQNGDRYKLNQINTEREQVKQEIEKMKSKISEATAKIGNLKLPAVTPKDK